MLGARRLALLTKLATAGAEAVTDVDACERAARAIGAAPADIPFALVYLTDDDGRRARLVATAGVTPGQGAAPSAIDLEDAGVVWPLGEAARHTAGIVVSLGATAQAGLPRTPWDAPPASVVVLALATPGHDRAAGYLVAAVSPRLSLDGGYRAFLALVAGRIATSIADARALDAERRRAEALAQLDAAKTAFFSNVSHEFRTPLTLMLGPVEELLRRSPAGDDRETLPMIHRNGHRLLRLVNSLLDFSRLEAGRLEAVYEPTDLAAYTAELASLFRPAVERAGLRLRLELEPLSEPVYVDRQAWEKVVLNLLSNALKFTFEGEIAVRLIARAGRAVLTVPDTGVGIPAEALPHVFERFHRLRGGRARTNEGTGIGLALVQELVRLHGGDTAVESVVDRGTTFTISVPLGASHLAPDRVGAERTLSSTGTGADAYVEEALRWEVEAPPDAAAVAPAGGSCVFVVDDNADMREYARRLLAPHWPVRTFPDGKQALEAARAEPPDLVLTDVMMPELDGFGLLRGLRANERTRDVPVILLSAHAGEESRVEGLDAGADDYLAKPFSAVELIARVRTHLGLARERRAALRREQEAREEAEAANRAKDEFLAVLSHELRTPLTTIVGWARMLSTQDLPPDRLRTAAAAIERNARMQAQLVEDLLDVSRIVSGKLSVACGPTALGPVLTDAVDNVRAAAEAKGVHLEVDVPRDPVTILGDAVRMQQVVVNLLANAVKFTPGGGRVTLSLRAGNGTARITVRDTGQGIDARTLPYIFDRFRQGAGGRDRAHGGLGLGLAIARYLVEAQGGSIVGESGGPGRGSAFTVTLPTVETCVPMITAVSGTGAFAVPLSGIRVLLVDDDPDGVAFVREVLERRHAEVHVAATADEAVATAARVRFDVVVTELKMRAGDGYELLRRLGDVPGEGGRPRPAVVALTAYDEAPDRDRAILGGFDRYLVKPVDADELVKAIAEARPVTPAA